MLLLLFQSGIILNSFFFIFVVLKYAVRIFKLNPFHLGGVCVLDTYISGASASL